MVTLGFWQLRRLDTVRTDNTRVRARLEQPAVDIEQVLPPGAGSSPAVFRRVRASGRYDGVSEILVRNRSLNGAAGSHVLTPLRLSDGRAVVVDRGWVPLSPTAEEEGQSRPPVLEPVAIEGVLFPSERKGVFGPSIPPSGRLTTMPRIDLPRIAKQLEYPVLPLYVRLQSQAPPQRGRLPVPPGLPDLSEGPHLSYAIQWFLFAAVALATYLALLRRARRRQPMDA
jgi:surfeit locus 1 family protein